jgi:signal transduction histidine kinase
MPDFIPKAKILVVDDLAEKRLAYHSILEELEEEVLAVSSGAEALKQVLKHDFAVILLDVHMPDIDGFETARLIRQRKRSGGTPIIFLTAFTDEVKTSQGYAMGAVDYLSTPVVPEILRAKVRVFVEMYQMRARMAHQAEREALRVAAEENARRSEILAEASRALANSLDLEAVLSEVACMSLPSLADCALVALSDANGVVARMKWAAVGSNGAPSSIAVDESCRIDPRLSSALDLVLGDETPEILEFPSEGIPAIIRTSGEGVPNRISLASAMLVLPLKARGRTLGALALMIEKPMRRWANSELAIIRELVGRAGIGLDNALLVRDIQEKDRLKNEFLAMLAHELRNPLAPIRNALPILDLAPADPARLGWVKDVIGRQVNHLVRLVDDLLDISRITERKIRLEMRVVDLADVVAAAVETSKPLIEAQGHRLTVSLPKDPIRLRVDATRMAQVLSNLLNNAAKYTPPGGEIQLAVEIAGDQALLRVKDSGIGIPQDMLVRVFELFTQVDRSLDRSQGGLGIGLTLVRELVAMHDGAVEVRSGGVNRGSEFTVRLPIVAVRSDSCHELQLDDPAASAVSRRILVVDDNRDAADSLAMLLDLDGHEVQTAYSGREGLEASQSFKPNTVLLDIGLPGLDGYEVARRIRGSGQREMLIIAVSGYGTEQDRRISSEAGFDHHFTKPLEYQRLKDLLNSPKA